MINPQKRISPRPIAILIIQVYHKNNKLFCHECKYLQKTINRKMARACVNNGTTLSIFYMVSHTPTFSYNNARFLDVVLRIMYLFRLKQKKSEKITAVKFQFINVNTT